MNVSVESKEYQKAGFVSKKVVRERVSREEVERKFGKMEVVKSEKVVLKVSYRVDKQTGKVLKIYNGQVIGELIKK